MHATQLFQVSFLVVFMCHRVEINVYTGLELVGQTYRSFLTVMTCLFYVGGMMLLPLISWLERDWRLLSLYTTLPFLLYYVYIK